MKKLLLLLIVLLSVGLLAACSDNEGAGAKRDVKETDKDSKEISSEYPYPSIADIKGTGTIVVDTPSGDSTNGNIPILFLEKDTLLDQIGYTGENFDGDKEVFFYVNEIFVEATQGSEMMAGPINLTDWLLEPGEYEVTAVQFKDNNPDNDVVHLAKAKYEIKPGS